MTKSWGPAHAPRWRSDTVLVVTTIDELRTHFTNPNAWRLWSSASLSLVECMHRRRSLSSRTVEPLTSLKNRVLERRRPRSRKAPLPTSPPASLTVIVLGFQTVSDPQITEGNCATADVERKWRCLYRIGEAILYINLLRAST